MQVRKSYPLIVALICIIASTSIFAGSSDVNRQIQKVIAAEKAVLEERMEQLSQSYAQQEEADPLVWSEEGDEIENSNTFYQIKDALRQIDIGLIMEWEMLKFTPESKSELRQYIAALKELDKKSTVDAIKAAKREHLESYVKPGGDFEKITNLMELGIENLKQSEEENAQQELQEALVAFEEFKKGQQEIVSIYEGLCQ